MTWLADFPGLGQALGLVKNAGKDFMNAYTPQAARNNISLTSGIFSESTAQSDIDAGRPIVLVMHPFNSEASFHVVIAYGYAKLDGADGFLVHYTHKGDKTQVWVPSSWFAFQMRMGVNHTHSLTDTGVNRNDTHRELLCSTCNFRTVDSLYNVSGGTISEAKYTLSGAVTIPNAINRYSETTASFTSKNITVIADNTFLDQENITDVTLPSQLVQIGEAAFYNCKQITNISIPSTVTSIGKNAFGFSGLTTFTVPSGVTRIAEGVFGATPLRTISFLGNVTHIGSGAFLVCENLTNIDLPTTVTTIGNSAFQFCSGLTSIIIPNIVTSIGEYAFWLANNLTIFTSRTDATGWGAKWNISNRPVVWGCTLSADNAYVVSFVKSAANPSNASAANGIANPVRKGYSFGGWYTAADYSGTQYMNLASVPNGTLYARWTENSCVAQGTMITLADGTQKAVETLTGNELLLVWNLKTGTFGTAPILFIDSDPMMSYEVINLTFSDGTSVKVISEHAFWDVNLNRYVFLRNDAAAYIGHWFNKQTTDANGNLTWTTVQLTTVHISYEVTTAWSPVTAEHLCYYVNGMLSMPGGTTGLINILQVDAATMQYDQAALQADIAEYGLFTYEEFAEIIDIPKTIFNAFDGQYLKIAIGKGLTTMEDIAMLIQRYAEILYAI